jgi:hypothetical protein
MSDSMVPPAFFIQDSFGYLESFCGCIQILRLPFVISVDNVIGIMLEIILKP